MDNENGFPVDLFHVGRHHELVKANFIPLGSPLPVFAGLVMYIRRW